MATISTDYSRENEDVSNYIPVAITSIILAADDAGTPRVYLLELTNRQGNRQRIGITLDQMKQLKMSMDECFAKFPQLGD